MPASTTVNIVIAIFAITTIFIVVVLLPRNKMWAGLATIFLGLSLTSTATLVTAAGNYIYGAVTIIIAIGLYLIALGALKA